MSEPAASPSELVWLLAVTTALFCLVFIAWAYQGRFVEVVELNRAPWKPVSYAFAIWGVIYLTTAVSAAAQSLFYLYNVDRFNDANALALHALSLGIACVWPPLASHPEYRYRVLSAVVLTLAAVLALVATSVDALLARHTVVWITVTHPPAALLAGWLLVAASLSLHGLVASGSLDEPSELPIGSAVPAMLSIVTSFVAIATVDLFLVVPVVWALCCQKRQTVWSVVGLLVSGVSLVVVVSFEIAEA